MLRILPWKFFVRHAARRYGVLDPATLLARVRRFAQPSEVQEPIELLRAGIIFHTRGLVNAKAIQHNLDWVWPFWVERQFNPTDPSFVPRAFSFSHINLTHRNWTAVGLPDLPIFPIVDPRGLVTPLHDGWSLDFWIITDAGGRLLPSKLADSEAAQQLIMGATLKVETLCHHDALRLKLSTEMVPVRGALAELRTTIKAKSDGAGWLVVAVRPYNPEGVQFIDHIALDDRGDALVVNEKTRVRMDTKPAALRMAHYAEGDVYLDLHTTRERTDIKCAVGMATAAALFRLEPGKIRGLTVTVALDEAFKQLDPPASGGGSRTWPEAVAATASLSVPDEKVRYLYDAAVRTLMLLSTRDLVPGPYTYRRFWFRDACLMLHPLLAIGLVERAARVIHDFPTRQTRGGYFLSQEGEWDSNGQVLWIAARFEAMTGQVLSPALDAALDKAVAWLERKRLASHATRPGTAGLLPAGFSAEHLGPNDFYYWDDFWAAGGLQEMAMRWRLRGRAGAAQRADDLAQAFLQSIEASLATIAPERRKGAVPAAPSRRLDSGAIGSMVADYPLQLFAPADPRMLRTADFLMRHSFHRGGFFQEMIHSGINAYLTLDLAQTYLRAGDPRFADLIRSTAALASPTGQWPEAIHPNTLGGCMGDGQHGWAAGEWVMMIRNCFVAEESQPPELVIGAGLLPEWRVGRRELSFGPTLTSWGTVTVRLIEERLTIEAQWRGEPAPMRIAVPGYQPIAQAAAGHPYRLEPLT
jgi:hypothetical protein